MQRLSARELFDKHASSGFTRENLRSGDAQAIIPKKSNNLNVECELCTGDLRRFAACCVCGKSGLPIGINIGNTCVCVRNTIRIAILPIYLQSASSRVTQLNEQKSI